MRSQPRELSEARTRFFTMLRMQNASFKTLLVLGSLAFARGAQTWESATTLFTDQHGKEHKLKFHISPSDLPTNDDLSSPRKDLAPSDSCMGHNSPIKSRKDEIKSVLERMRPVDATEYLSDIKKLFREAYKDYDGEYGSAQYIKISDSFSKGNVPEEAYDIARKILKKNSFDEFDTSDYKVDVRFVDTNVKYRCEYRQHFHRDGINLWNIMIPVTLSEGLPGTCGTLFTSPKGGDALQAPFLPGKGIAFQETRFDSADKIFYGALFHAGPRITMDNTCKDGAIRRFLQIRVSISGKKHEAKWKGAQVSGWTDKLRRYEGRMECLSCYSRAGEEAGFKTIQIHYPDFTPGQAKTDDRDHWLKELVQS